MTPEENEKMSALISDTNADERRRGYKMSFLDIFSSVIEPLGWDKLDVEYKSIVESHVDELLDELQGTNYEFDTIEKQQLKYDAFVAKVTSYRRYLRKLP